MTKMWCFWCEDGYLPKNMARKGYVWVHLKCLEELLNMREDVNAIKRILAGEQDETVQHFLNRIGDFDRRWENTMKIIEGLTAGGKEAKKHE